MKKISSTIVGLFINLILLTGCVITILTEDNEAPNIVFDSEEITYIKGEDMRCLLEHVKAFDEIDGDVTETLMVESISLLSEGDEAKVVFVAKDSRNNIGKVGILVQYKEKNEKEK